MLTKTTSTVGAPQTTVFFSRTWSQTGKDWRKGYLRSLCQFSLWHSLQGEETQQIRGLCTCNCLNELASFGRELLNLPSCYSPQAPFLNSIYLDSSNLVIGWVRAFKLIWLLTFWLDHQSLHWAVIFVFSKSHIISYKQDKTVMSSGYDNVEQRIQEYQSSNIFDNRCKARGARCWMHNSLSKHS